MDQSVPPTPPNPPTPSVPGITGVAQALVTTLGLEQAVTVLLAQFDWDRVFTAVSHLDGVEGGQALWITLERMPG